MSSVNCNAADETQAGKTVTRPAAVANRFYTGNDGELRKEVEKYIAAGSALKKHPRIIISPHAGFVFSGPVAGIGFASIDKTVNKVILIGPSHHKYFSGVSIPDVDAYETPLGNIRLNKTDIKKLRSSKMVHAHADAHDQEHCLEVQLPFLQVLLSDFSIIPIITASKNNPSEIADLIYPLIDNKTLIVISSDFSHYMTHNEAKKTDTKSIESIIQNKEDGFLDACGEVPIRVAMQLSKKMNLKPKLLDARNSGETAPQYSNDGRVVGYASIVYLPSENGQSIGNKEEKTEKELLKLSESDKSFLLKLAREALNRAVKGEKPPAPKDIPDVAQELCGCFVTLTKHGQLRGCIGYIEGRVPLYQAVIENAKNAALGDPRFPNVSTDELDAIKVEVSVLTKPEPFQYSNPKDLLNKINANVDGIILSKASRQSTFLPQVWDQLPEKVAFLEHLAMKAGLDRDDWKEAQYKKYQAIHFEEE